MSNLRFAKALSAAHSFPVKLVTASLSRRSVANYVDVPGDSRTGKRLSFPLFFRLAIMMALQWAVWVWFPFLGMFLLDGRSFTPDQVANIFIAAAIGIMLAPFIAGQCVDRYVATEKYLAVAHLLSAVVVWQLSWVSSYAAVLALTLIYSLLFGPTTALTNSLALHHVPDRDRHFGIIRVCGAFGFIPASIVLGHWLAYAHAPNSGQAVDLLIKEGAVAESERDSLTRVRHAKMPGRAEVSGHLVRENDEQLVLLTDTGEVAIAKDLARIWNDERVEARRRQEIAKGVVDGFKMSAVLGLIMGLYCVTLPHTPPQSGRQKYAFIEALQEIRRRPLLTLFLVSLPVSCVHQVYFIHTGRFIETLALHSSWIDRVFGVGGGGLMTLGQMSEIILMATIGLYASHFRRRTFLLLGLAAYAVRFALFAYTKQLDELTGVSPALTVIAGLILHGPCFTWFWFLGYLIVDEETTADVRGSAQSLYNLVLLGIGGIFGSKFAAFITNQSTLPGNSSEYDYRSLFSWPMWVSIACFLAIAVFYPSKSTKADRNQL